LGVDATLQVSAGGGHPCGLTALGQVYCWGQNYAGVLGLPSAVLPVNSFPGRIGGLVGMQEIVQGEAHSCASDADGAVFCWGQARQLGLALPPEYLSEGIVVQVDGLRGAAQLT